MSGNNQESRPIQYPTISSPTPPTLNPFAEPTPSATEPLTNPFYNPTPSPTESTSNPFSGPTPSATESPSNPLSGPTSSPEEKEKSGTPPLNPCSAAEPEKTEKSGTPLPASVSPPTPSPLPGPSSSATASDNSEKWGTHVMGTPAVPTCHPSNQKAALWGVADQKDYQNHHQPYIQYTPIDKTSSSGAFDSVLQKFNSWGAKAETTANNIWHNLKTGTSVSGAAWGKVNLRAKAMTGGGFETLYKQTFATYPNEMLKKTFACYLSTSTGPVSGTLYLSNVHVAFCSDRPLSFTAPSGQESWSYYKILIPLASIGSINPVVMRENPTERYIQLISTDGHDFWFMGFVNYEKATNHLFDGISNFAAAGVPVAQPTPAFAGVGGKHI